MTPQEIDLIATTWSRVRREHKVGEARAALEVALASTASNPAVRASWILEVVDQLHGLFSHPAALGAAATELIGRRGSVTFEEIRADQEALLYALEVTAGPLDAETADAWKAGCALFWDIVASRALSPFGTR